MSYLFVTGYFDDIIGEITGLSVNQVTMGRQGLYSGAMDVKSQNIVSIVMYGIGLGNISTFINSDGELLHNDVLRIFIENGLLVFSLFFLCLYKKLDLKEKGVIIVLNVLFLTDNTFFYPPVIFTLFLMLDLFDSNNMEDRVVVSSLKKECKTI